MMERAVHIAFLTAVLAVSACNRDQVTYSPEDIRRFFDDVRTGKYKGREQERSRIERDIFAAQREGRIRMT